MPTASDLSTAPLLADLPAQALAELADRFEEEDYAHGKHVVTEGSAGYAFYVVAEGRAEVTRGGNRLGELGPGDFFGEIAILGPTGRRTATVTAVTALRVWVLFGTSFRALQLSHPAAAEELSSAMRSRLTAG